MSASADKKAIRAYREWYASIRKQVMEKKPTQDKKNSSLTEKLGPNMIYQVRWQKEWTPEARDALQKMKADELTGATRKEEEEEEEAKPFTPGRASAFAAKPASRKKLRKVVAELLTERQLEIAKLVWDGRTSAEIGTLLDISVKTVEFHLEGIYERLHIERRVDLVRVMERYFGD